MTTLLAIDPGVKTLGWAFFVDGVLCSAGLSRVKDKTASLAECAAAHVSAIAPIPDYRIVAERMTTRGRTMRFAHQDLIDVNLITGAFRADQYFEPQEWKGRQTKEVHQPRILAALSPAELEVIEAVMPPSLRHNAIDAVGIGLYDLGRMSPCPTSPSTRSTEPASRKSPKRGARSPSASPRRRAKPPRKKIGGRNTPPVPKPR